jgi:hypothetical protein
MSQKDTHKYQTYHVEALLPDVSDVVKSWMKTPMNENDRKVSEQNDTKLQQFFEQPDIRKRRAGLDAHKLKKDGVKKQQRGANNKINTDLKYAIINKHDAKKRKKRKGILVDYGEDDQDEQTESTDKPVEKKEDSDEEEGKSSMFTKGKGKSRNIINRANTLIQSYTTNTVEKPKKKRKT